MILARARVMNDDELEIVDVNTRLRNATYLAMA